MIVTLIDGPFKDRKIDTNQDVIYLPYESPEKLYSLTYKVTGSEGFLDSKNCLGRFR
jgi:hypothetical protein